jgi:hypothetical protein
LGQLAAFRCGAQVFRCDEPAILLSSQAEVERAGCARPSPGVSTIFYSKPKKAHPPLVSRSIPAGPIHDGGDIEFFEIRDIEGNLLQIRQEP